MLNLIVGFIGLFFGSWQDLKTREVPDYINYSMIIFGLGYGLILSILNSDNSFILSILGLLVGWVIGYLFYITGQWGGGDAKSLMGLGALMGFGFSNIPLFAILVLNIVFFGAIYGVLWSIYLAIQNHHDFRIEFKKRLHDRKVMRIRIAILLYGVLSIFVFLFSEDIARYYVLGLAVFVFFSYYFYHFSKTVETIAMEKTVKISDLTEGDWVIEEVLAKKYVPEPPYNYLKRQYTFKNNNDFWIKLYFWFQENGIKVNRLIINREKFLKKKLEGGWDKYYNSLLASIAKEFGEDNQVIVEEIHEMLISDKKISGKKKLSKTIINWLEGKGFYYDKERICGKNDKEGIDNYQIELLKKHNIESVRIKEGIPFLPSFLIAYIITLYFGNWLVFLL